jgi:hypothetical protein
MIGIVDLYVGPAVLTLDGETVGVTVFLDSAKDAGLYTWCGFLETRDEELRLRAVEADDPHLALPGREGCPIDVMYTNERGLGFMGAGPSPLETSDHQ